MDSNSSAVNVKRLGNEDGAALQAVKKQRIDEIKKKLTICQPQIKDSVEPLTGFTTIRLDDCNRKPHGPEDLI